MDAIKQKYNALLNAAPRIVKIFEFEDSGGKPIHRMKNSVASLFPFLHKKFNWVTDPTRKVKSTSANSESLDQIFINIAKELHQDELSQYAREENGQQYFQRAWGSPGQYRNVSNYFTHDESTDWVKAYDKEGTTIPMLNAMIEYRATLAMDPTEKIIGHNENIESHIKYIKNSLATCEHHMEYYRKSLLHQLEQIDTVKSFIKGVLRTSRGEIFDADEKSMKEVFMEIASSDKQESLVEEKLQGFLRDRGMDSPMIFDHIRAALEDTTSLVKGFNPKKIYDFFTVLETNTKTNAETCSNIIKYCADTRAHIDRIVTQECRKVGLEA